MTKEESQSYIDDIVTQCIISFTKTTVIGESDVDTLRRVLKNELSLGFKHLIVE